MKKITEPVAAKKDILGHPLSQQREAAQLDLPVDGTVVPFRKANLDGIGSSATIRCSDNLSFMRSLPSESIQLIATSPPYNLGKPYEKRRSSIEAYLEAQAGTIAEAKRVLHPNGSLCWQVGNYVQDGEVFPLDILLYDLFKKQGFRLRNRIIWAFGHGLHCQRRFSGRYETILWFTKSDKYFFNLDPVRVPVKYPNKKHFIRAQIGRSATPYSE